MRATDHPDRTKQRPTDAFVSLNTLLLTLSSAS